ncbi:hypothetical protein D9C73_009368 [Collichthys lucidus]|uniref:Uncharacterized protein n=1 Tax=Collichthys lucidus TaxID=240159 RepID=A0A4U5UQ09_COLLU|nr:hypothetical protein D9C73_009368 [Collichthys lucidus]
MPESKGREQGGGGGGCSRGKRKLRKGGSRTAIPVLFTITEEEEGQRRRDACRKKKRASYSQYKSEDGRAGSAGSGQTYTPTPSRTTTSNSPSNNAATKTDSLLFNKIDERQRNDGKLAKLRSRTQNQHGGLRCAHIQYCPLQ